MRKGVLLGLGALFLHPAFALAQVPSPPLPHAIVEEVPPPGSGANEGLPSAGVEDVYPISETKIEGTPVGRPALTPTVTQTAAVAPASTPVARPEPVKVGPSGNPTILQPGPHACVPGRPGAGPCESTQAVCSCLDCCLDSCCCTPARAPRIWTSTEFLLWWTKGVPVDAPLLTEATSTTDPTAGALGSANTAVLLGGQTYALGTRYGGRFSAGAWLDPDGLLGLEGGYLFIAPRSTTTQFGTDGQPGSPIIGSPILNAATGQENFNGVGGPGFPGGGYLTLTNSLQSGEANLLGRLIRNDNTTLAGLVGFRYLTFRENLAFGSGEQDLAGPGTFVFSEFDHFQAINNFYGGNLGMRGEYRFGNLFINGAAKCALGAVNQMVTVTGGAVDHNVMGGSAFNFAVPAGIYALPTNIGTHSRTIFTVVPEAACNVGYNLTQNIRAYMGYTFLYIGNVARPGAQIDHDVNPTQSLSVSSTGNQLVGPPVPTFSFSRTDFWAQGINFGLAMRW